ncbi:MAG: cytochrome c oxidase subunit 3 [Acidobacteriaceae bacterium]
MSTIPLSRESEDIAWNPPYKGTVGILTLITGEVALFSIFVVAYIYYIGKSTYGPTPRQVLETPVFYTICLLSSSLTIWLAERALAKQSMQAFSAWWGATIALAAIFLYGTAREWQKLITVDHLTISTNLFGTTFYSLVGLHATHVVVGMLMMLTVLLFSITGHLHHEHARKVETLSLYWHFVDAVWIVVFTVVYIVGR